MIVDNAGNRFEQQFEVKKSVSTPVASSETTRVQTQEATTNNQNTQWNNWDKDWDQRVLWEWISLMRDWKIKDWLGLMWDWVTNYFFGDDNEKDNNKWTQTEKTKKYDDNETKEFVNWFELATWKIKNWCNFITDLSSAEKKGDEYEQIINLENVPWWWKCEVKILYENEWNKFSISDLKITVSNIIINPYVITQNFDIEKDKNRQAINYKNIEEYIIWLLYTPYNICKSSWVDSYNELDNKIKKEIAVSSSNSGNNALEILYDIPESDYKKNCEYMNWKNCIDTISSFYFI